MSPGSCELTFNVKEVRAFLSYCDGLGEFDCRISFAGMGQPMLCETVPRHPHAGGGLQQQQHYHRDDDAGHELTAPLKMSLVVATLAESQSQHSQTPTPSPQPQQQHHVQTARMQQQQQQQREHATHSQAAADVSQAFLQKQSAAMYHAHNSQGGSEVSEHG
jgi:hypothetical protein